MTSRANPDFFQWMGTIALLLGLTAQSVLAHQFSIAQGTATVYPDRVAIVLEFGGEDLRHVDGSPPPDDASALTEWVDGAARQHGHDICDHLILRDMEGNTISGRVVETNLRKMVSDSNDVDRLRDVRIVHSLSYPLRERATLLTFQQSTDQAISLRTQWIMAVRADGEERERIVRLTSQGNTETLAFDSCDKQREDTTHQMRDERFRTMYVVVRNHEQSMTLDLFAPLTIVETFVPTSRRNLDYAVVEEQQAILAAWVTLVDTRFDVTHNGQPIGATATTSEFVPPCPGVSESGSSTQRMSAYAARVHVQFAYAHAPSNCELTWKLFNNLVLNVPLFIEDEAGFSTAELSTYAPRLALTGLAKPTPEIRKP